MLFVSHPLRFLYRGFSSEVYQEAVEAAAEAGIKSIIQPGGAKKDAEVIAKCDELGIAMVFSGVRLFKH